MLVTIKRNRLGGFIFEPKNQVIVNNIHKNMIENGCNPTNTHKNLVLRYEDIVDLVTRNDFKDIDEGYSVTKQLDNWLVRQYFGYCSC